MIKFAPLLLLSLILTTAKSQQEMTPKDMLSMNRLGASVLSVDGQYLVFSVSQWSEESGKTVNSLKYKQISGGEPTEITTGVSSPTFTTFSPNHLFFLKGGQIHTIPFPPNPEDRPFQLTNYAVPINDFKIGKDAIVFSADVYFNCTTFECSKQLTEEDEKHDYEVYDGLLMFHWDKWLKQGKGSHLFLQRIKLEEGKISLDGSYKDLTPNMEINVPFLEEGKDNWDVSSDGKMAAFSGLLRTKDESWNTSWKTYFIIFDEMKEPYLITSKNDGRTELPKFSLDNTKIAYLSMKTPLLEAQNLHLEVYNILANRIEIVSDKDFDLSISSFIWINDNNIYFVSEKKGINVLYKLNFRDIVSPTYSVINEIDKGISSYGTPFTALKNRKIILSSKVAYNAPPRIVKIEEGAEDELIYYPNEGFEQKFYLAKPEKFEYIGAYNESVQGWILNPQNLDASKKYPVVLLIHGGPEGSWSSDWSYRWNPQTWANHGLVVIGFNIHGSTGVSGNFTDSVRNNWGTAPYEDIILGLEYVFSKYNYTDREKTCAAGGSYGGYMINWLQGHPDKFKFKCMITHDGAFSLMSKFYGTDELWMQKASFCPRNNIDCQPSDPEARKIIEANSPERFVDKWYCPMIVMHGGKDYRIPLTEALSSFTVLQLKNIDSKLCYFPEENHWVLRPENSVIWNKEVLDWIDKYTK